jgi:hypothetical protein
MAKAVHNDVLDASLDKIATANIMTLCSQEPTTRTEAVTTYALADVAMTPGDGNDYTVSDGDTNGRKVRMAAKSGVTVDTTGTGNHVALCDGTTLLYVTTCTSKAVTASDQVNFPVWDVEIADPT